jgi:hypothetical protein
MRSTTGSRCFSSSDVSAEVGFVDVPVDAPVRCRLSSEDSSCDEVPVVLPGPPPVKDRAVEYFRISRAGCTVKQCASVKLSTGQRQAVHLLGPDLAETADMADPKHEEQTTCFLVSWTSLIIEQESGQLSVTHRTWYHPDLPNPIVQPVTCVARASLEVKSTGMAECAVLVLGCLRLERLAIRACDASKGLFHWVKVALGSFGLINSRVNGMSARGDGIRIPGLGRVRE